VGGGVEAETHRVLTNLEAILEEAGSSLDRAVKVTVYLADMGDFGAMNGIYSAFFPAERPARGVVEVSALPRGACMAAEVTALA